MNYYHVGAESLNLNFFPIRLLWRSTEWIEFIYFKCLQIVVFYPFSNNN